MTRKGRIDDLERRVTALEAAAAGGPTNGKPHQCPHCGSSDIEGGEVSVDEGTARQLVSCNICDTSWLDEYKLVSRFTVQCASISTTQYDQYPTQKGSVQVLKNDDD